MKAKKSSLLFNNIQSHCRALRDNFVQLLSSCGVLEHQQRVYLENNVPDRFSAPRPPHVGSGAAARASGVRTPPERCCSCMLLRAPASVCMRERVGKPRRGEDQRLRQRRDKCTRGLGAERDRA